MNIKSSNAMLGQAKFAAAETLEAAWEDAMKDMERANKVDPSKPFTLGISLKILAGNQAASFEPAVSWGVRKKVEGEMVSIALEGDMFGDLK